MAKRAVKGPVKKPAEMDHNPANCRAREMLDRVGDRWSVYVISALDGEGTLRFSDLMRRVEGVSQRMLTVTLRGLERDGLVQRTVYPKCRLVSSIRSRRWGRRSARSCAI